MSSKNGFPTFISAQLQYLLSHSQHSFKVERAWSGCKDNLPGSLDRFTLLIPYCLDYLRWDVVYNAEFPLAPPDIIFGPEDEHFNAFLVSSGSGGGNLLQGKNTLSDWNYRDHTQLLALIDELRDKYVSYQRKRVGEVDDDRLKFEMSTILLREGIEMHLCSGAGAEEPEEVKFAVPLMDMDINKMVVACPWKHQQKIYLQVIYPIGRKYVSAPSVPRLKLMSSSELKSLFLVNDVKLPAWLDGMCMAEYLPHLEELLQKQVSEAVALIDVRRRFIEALVPLFGRPLEADPVFCRKASFLAASGPFTFLVHFHLSAQFPKQPPSLMLQSTRHYNTHGSPAKSQLLAEYPWSPRWDASQMAERIFDFLADECLVFKKQCNESQLQH